MNRQTRFFLFALRLGALIGIVFGMAAGAAVLDPPLFGAALGALSGAIEGTALMALIGGAEIFLPRTRIGRTLERAPFLVILVVKLIAYGAVILLVVGGRLGPRIASFALGGEFAQAIDEQMRIKLPAALVVVIDGVIVSFLALVRQLADLVGSERTFRDIVLGRYRRPRTEERFFLFVDIVGSTPLAERLGPASVHGFLDRVFQIVSDPIDDHEGDVYQYVGDEIVITWTLAEGRWGARPIACYFAVKRALELAAKDFKREFGAVPQLRAALHAGPVITGEVGGRRRAIVFHGDVMNTTSRLENATRDLDRPFLVSEDAMSRLDSKEAYKSVDLGQQQLRGRAAPVHVYAVELGAEAQESSARQ